MGRHIPESHMPKSLSLVCGKYFIRKGFLVHEISWRLPSLTFSILLCHINFYIGMDIRYGVQKSPSTDEILLFSF